MGEAFQLNVCYGYSATRIAEKYFTGNCLVLQHMLLRGVARKMDGIRFKVAVL
jgi:hypothetical protein